MKIKKKILLIVIIVLTILMLKTNQSYAALKSNGGTVATHKIADWLTQIRQMETLGGTLGLNETINSTTLLSTSGSNDLDCHMEKIVNMELWQSYQHQAMEIQVRLLVEEQQQEINQEFI